ncbi:hypothetical protein SAMN02745134_01209 [Clostridium acidisoli DSM 12555]|jgi:hypothetical protein|uniref:YokE-like PH domain-containing protein n=1 Tax=Clostridium acidisoli DSM 12555 TaxID=1121291 RepID=A0A1W1XBB1_9CLOT|nr:hypothetical protein [Clostridium acidisoli]SMC21160.1 hypothetical protein SAMN02745134_01209 [Clostridium acidisoli DSM 12555]
MAEMITKNNLLQYKREDENFIYGVRGLLRLSFGKEILFNYMPMESLDFFVDATYNQAIDATLAVTDKRIMFISSKCISPNCSNLVYSFDIEEIGVRYRKVLGKREFVITSNGKELFEFTEPEIVFECYNKQRDKVEKIKLILSEYVFNN